VTKPVAIAAHVTELRFFQPTTSFAFINAKKPRQDKTLMISGHMFVMVNAPVRRRSAAPTGEEEAARAKLPVT
jgi:hypothetical protein